MLQYLLEFAALGSGHRFCLVSVRVGSCVDHHWHGDSSQRFSFRAGVRSLVYVLVFVLRLLTLPVWHFGLQIYV